MKGDLEKLQGAWGIVALEVEGRKMGHGAIRGGEIVVKGDAFTTVSMGAIYNGKVTVDESKSPRAVDLLFEEGPEKGNKSLGIYELDGDRWKICLTLRGKTRPKEFATKAGSGHALETLERQRSMSPAVALRQELALLAGDWRMVSGVRDGHALPKNFVASARRQASGNETTVTFGGEVFLKAAYALGPSKTPKTIDYVVTGGQNQGEIQHGIYTLEGDTLTLLVAAPGAPRPIRFETTEGDGGTLAVWRRKTPKAGGH